MDVVRHQHVAAYDEVVADSHGFEGALHEIARFRGGEVWTTVEAAEGHVMEVAGLLATDETSGHWEIVNQRTDLFPEAHISEARCGAPKPSGGRNRLPMQNMRCDRIFCTIPPHISLTRPSYPTHHPMRVTALRLSVLDQSPVPSGSTPADALRNSIALAQHVESLGYTRFWMSEHHSMDLLACTAPEIMLSRIGAETSRIRLGSGGIMLPHYTPFKVAETFRTLHALYPGRIDLGIGRAPGGGPIETTALRRYRGATSNAIQQDDFPDQLSELIAFLHHGFPPCAPVLPHPRLTR